MSRGGRRAAMHHARNIVRAKEIARQAAADLARRRAQQGRQTDRRSH